MHYSLERQAMLRNECWALHLLEFVFFLLNINVMSFGSLCWVREYRQRIWSWEQIHSVMNSQDEFILSLWSRLGGEGLPEFPQECTVSVWGCF